MHGEGWIPFGTEESTTRVKRFAVCVRRSTRAMVGLYDELTKHFGACNFDLSYHGVRLYSVEGYINICEMRCGAVYDFGNIPYEDKWYVVVYDAESKAIYIYDENKNLVRKHEFNTFSLRRLAFNLYFEIWGKDETFTAGTIIEIKIDWIAIKRTNLHPVDPYIGIICNDREYDKLWEFSSDKELYDFCVEEPESAYICNDHVRLNPPKGKESSIVHYAPLPARKIACTLD